MTYKVVSKGITQKLLSYLNKGSERSALAKKNVIGSFFNKGIAILISFLLVPITIKYLDTEQYGVWLTLSSIVVWISYFDVGLVHGFKNRFAECRAKGEDEKARRYVSTAYATMAGIFSVVFLATEIANKYIDWADILKLDSKYSDMLQAVVTILLFCSCTQFVLNVCTAMLVADQRSAFASGLATASQFFALIAIYVLTLTSGQSMVYLSWALGGIPCLTILIASVILFRSKRYKIFSPSIKHVDRTLVKNFIGLGGKFFIIQLSMLLIFQMTNLIITRVEGPEAVTLYNVVYKYFSATQMIFTIILSPFWAAYTDAYTRGDYDWMTSVYKKLHKTYYILAALGVVLLIISPLAYDLWLDGAVDVPWALSAAMCIYLLILSYSNMFMILINGIGKVFVQMIVYLSFGIISIPTLYIACKEFGLIGIITTLSMVYLIQAVFAKIQLRKILRREAYGIWDK